MGEKGSEKQLTGFLNAVLGNTGRKPIESLEIRGDRTIVKDLRGGKSCVLDVLAVLADATAVNIEVQIRNEHNIGRRSLFYWGRLYNQGLKKGQDYRSAPNVIAVNIIDFDFPPEGYIHTCFQLRESKNPSIVLTSALEIHFVSMVKWRKEAGKDIRNNELHRWLAWLDPKSPPELAEEAKNMDIAIMAADKRQAFVMQNRKIMDIYERRQKAQWDYASAMSGARREGMEEGLEKGLERGREEGMEKVARNAIAKGIPAELVCDITGLDMEYHCRFDAWQMRPAKPVS
jgi:predicted transposase/invertase (TIGR01784 family)